MSGVYSETDTEGWQRVHANGERTNVYVLPMGERYVAVAVDVNPMEYEGVASEILGYAPTETDAEQRAKNWMENNPKGVAAKGGSGTFGKLLTGLQKLDQSAKPTDTEQSE